MKWLVVSVVAFALLGCQSESEQDCFKRLDSDFENYALTARELGDSDGAITARQSALTAVMILHDSDRNLCDYVSAGPSLERK